MRRRSDERAKIRLALKDQEFEFGDLGFDLARQRVTLWRSEKYYTLDFRKRRAREYEFGRKSPKGQFTRVRPAVVNFALKG